VLAAATLASSALSVVYTFAAARLLAPREYGELVALLSAVGLMGAPAGAVQMVAARSMARAGAAGSVPAFRAAAGSLLKAMALATAALAGLIVLLAPWLAAFLRLETAAPVLWLAPLAAAVAVGPALRGLVQGACRFGTLGLLMTNDVLFKVALGIGLIAAGFGSSGALAAMAAGVWSGLALAAWAMREFFQLRRTAAASADVAEMARFSLPALSLTGGLIALATLDTIVARHFLAAEEAGAYAAAAIVGRSLFWVSTAVASVVLPLAARYVRAGGADTARALLWPALGLTGAAAGVGVAVFHLAPDLLMRLLFGEQYAAGAALLPLYGWAALLLAIANVAVNYLMGRGRSLAALPIALALATFAILTVLYHATGRDIVRALTAAGVAFLVGLAPLVRAELRPGRAAASGSPVTGSAAP
jgi:O-antigen/teichoic acid export membrane protein